MVANTGLRLGEALHLRAEDYDKDGRLLAVRSRADHPIKSKHERMVPLRDLPAVEDVLTRIGFGKRPPDLLFHARGKPDTPLQHRNVHRALQTVARRMGLRVNWHALRHTWCTEQAVAGVELEQLATLAGHAVHSTTQGYIHRAKARNAKIRSIV